MREWLELKPDEQVGVVSRMYSEELARVRAENRLLHRELAAHRWACFCIELMSKDESALEEELRALPHVGRGLRTAGEQLGWSDEEHEVAQSMMRALIQRMKPKGN